MKYFVVFIFIFNHSSVIVEILLFSVEYECFVIESFYLHKCNSLQENKIITETNEELNAQLLANSLQEGRSLVNQGTEISLADEFETLTKDEVSQYYFLML